MTKDKFQVGDLVIKDPTEYYGIGLVVATSRSSSRNPTRNRWETGYALKVYWFKLGRLRVEWSTSLNKPDTRRTK